MCLCVGRVEEADIILQRSEGGVDSSLLYAKTISKYIKDLMNYVEKRTSLGKQASVRANGQNFIDYLQCWQIFEYATGT